MNTTLLALVLVLLLCVTYFVCGIPFGLVIANRKAGVDVRSTGSGNIGTTNAMRTMGKKGGVAVFVLDFGKGLLSGFAALFVLATFIPGAGVAADSPVSASTVVALAFLCCTLGHIFSPWLKFKGGKGIAVAVGCLFVTFGVMGALLEIAVFAVVVAISRFVSAGSLAAAIVCPIFAAYYFLFQSFDPIAWVLCLVTALVVIWAHRGNIHRLATGTERRIGDKAKE